MHRLSAKEHHTAAVSQKDFWSSVMLFKKKNCFPFSTFKTMKDFQTLYYILNK